jgi:predicted MFS family arabinose efflux permease
MPDSNDASLSLPRLDRPRLQPAAPDDLLIAVMAFATGALAANLYYAQPLIGTIAPRLGIPVALAGSITSFTQIGFGMGLFFLVPLVDLVENKRLVISAVLVTAVALLACAVLRNASLFFAACLLVGFTSSGTQALIPFVAMLAPEARRGRVVGNVMAGLLTGIMLARPAALFIAGSFGWRSVFWGSAGLMGMVALLLAWRMPSHRPDSGLHYGQILRTMLGIFRRSAILRRRALYQMLMFTAFNMFWTAAPFLLARKFGLDPRGIGLFALAGAGGALAAPFAGRLADRKLFRPATAGAGAVLGVCFAATAWVDGVVGLVVLAGLAVLIDAAVQTNQVVGQRLVFSVPAATRGRANAIYMTCVFVGGALGSIVATLLYHRIGWDAVAALGALIGAGMLMASLMERGG